MDLIATINTILLPPLLLVVLISFVSALIYDEGSSKAPEQSSPKNATAKIIQPIERELREVLWSDLWAEPEVPTVQPAAESAIPVAAMPKPDAVPTRPYLKGCCDHNASLVVWGILGRGLGAILILDLVLNLL